MYILMYITNMYDTCKIHIPDVSVCIFVQIYIPTTYKFVLVFIYPVCVHIHTYNMYSVLYMICIMCYMYYYLCALLHI